MARSPAPIRSATTAQLSRSGLSAHDVRRLLAEERLHRVSRGIFLDAAGVPGSADAFTHERYRHFALAVACARALPGSYLVGPSACLAHGLPLLRVPTRCHLARRGRLWSVRPEVSAHRSWPHEGPTVHEGCGVPVQPIEAAVVETAGRFGALAGLIPADAALARGDITVLGPAVEAWGCRSGVRAVRAVRAFADGRRESPLETRVAWEAHQAGFTLIPQVTLRDEAGEWLARVDFTVQGTRVVVEADGIGKYREHTDFRDERVRHNQIEELGWIVVRVCSDDLRFGRFIPRLAAAVARARPMEAA